MVPSDLLFHKEHEWVRIDGNRATVGISHYAQNALGDIVYVALPKIGTLVSFAREMAEMESTKAVSPLYAPIGGTVVSVNEALKDHPELINSDPYGKGWVVVVETKTPAEVDQLMTAGDYENFIKTLDH